MPAELLAVITLVLGWFLSESSSWFKTRRDERSRRLQRTESKEDQRAEFQRQTLLDIQEKLLELSRSTFRIYFADLTAQNQGKRWGTDPVPEDLAEKDRALTMTLTALTVRIADDSLREQVGNYRETCKRVSFATSQDEARQAHVEMGQLFEGINARLGELLRSTY